MLLLMRKMEVKFNNDDFDFYSSGVMVLERLKNGVSSGVHVFTHEPFNQSFSNLNILFLMTKLRSRWMMAIFTFSVQELWFLKDWKIVFPVILLHLLMNHLTKAFQILICCYWWQNGGHIWYWRTFTVHQLWFLLYILLKNARTQNVNKSGLSIGQPLVSSLSL